MRKIWVAIARALAPNPSLLLLDEPFGALDMPSKEKLMEDIRSILLKEEKSTVLVTHNIDEALFFSDIIMIINPLGRVQDIMKVRLPRKRKISIQDTPDYIKLKKQLSSKMRSTVHKEHSPIQS